MIHDSDSDSSFAKVGNAKNLGRISTGERKCAVRSAQKMKRALAFQSGRGWTPIGINPCLTDALIGFPNQDYTVDLLPQYFSTVCDIRVLA